MSFFSQKRSWSSRLNPFARRVEHRRPAASRPTLRPTLEVLEDRFLPTVDFFGGPLIPHVEVNTLFVGQEWQSGSLSNLVGGLNGYLKTLVNSPYMDMLSQYNVGRGSFGSTRIEWYNNDSDAKTPMNDNNLSYPNGQTELQYLLVSAIQQGSYPPLDQNQLYVIFLPPGEQVEAPGGLMNNHAPNGFLGYHSSFNSQYGRISYAVLPYPGGPNYLVNGLPTLQNGDPAVFDSLTSTVSHELSEAVTDPVPPSSPNPVRGVTGWIDPQRDEIGDIVNQQNVYWNGYVVQKEANQQDQGMVPALPSAGLSIAATANQSFNGTVMNFTDNSTTVFGDTAAQPLGGSPLPGSSFAITINWGDGQTSSGQVVYNGNGQFSVVGSHSYAQSGSYQISVTATDPYGVTASAESSVTVAPAPTVLPPPNINPPPTYNPPTYNPQTYNPPTYNPPTYNPPNNPPNNSPPNDNPPPQTPTPMQLFMDGYVLAIDLFGAGGSSSPLAEAALIHDMETVPGGLFNPYLDAGFSAALSALHGGRNG
jgi:archaellum component FlaF (FlaF/FlaG flagellin family)